MSNQKTKAEVSEGALSRAGAWDGRGFALLTPWRHDAKEERAYQELLRVLASAGYRPARLVGYWRDERGGRVRDPLLTATGIGLDEALRLARAHHLCAFVYLGPETGGRVAVVHPDGRVEKRGAPSARAVEAAWREARDLGPVFEGFLKRPGGWAEALVHEKEERVMEGTEGARPGP